MWRSSYITNRSFFFFFLRKPADFIFRVFSSSSLTKKVLVLQILQFRRFPSWKTTWNLLYSKALRSTPRTIHPCIQCVPRSLCSVGVVVVKPTSHVHSVSVKNTWSCTSLCWETVTVVVSLSTGTTLPPLTWQLLYWSDQARYRIHAFLSNPITICYILIFQLRVALTSSPILQSASNARRTPFQPVSNFQNSSDWLPLPQNARRRRRGRRRNYARERPHSQSFHYFLLSREFFAVPTSFLTKQKSLSSIWISKRFALSSSLEDIHRLMAIDEDRTTVVPNGAGGGKGVEG
jgi:hypothetical protein